MAGSSSNVESNLDKLLQSVTPIVPLKPIPESCIHALNRVWNPVGNPITEYFTLGDLWKRYKKWSVYGVETPVTLKNRKDVVQYFTPYLSAIEIFTNKSLANISLSCRSLSDDSDEDESESEYLSDEDESESDKLTRSASNTSSNNSSDNFNKAWDVDSEDSSINHDDSLPTRDCRRNLYIKFHDSCSPYRRIPLRNQRNSQKIIQVL